MCEEGLAPSPAPFIAVRLRSSSLTTGERWPPTSTPLRMRTHASGPAAMFDDVTAIGRRDPDVVSASKCATLNVIDLGT